jgi:tetratricopeptide (TPR) repeat protein/CHAT domain-containing protein
MIADGAADSESLDDRALADSTSPRARHLRIGSRVLAAALLVPSALLPTIAPLAQTFQSTRLEITTAIARGRYEVAQREAAGLLAATQSAFGPASFESLVAADLVVEARVLNGYGATGETRRLAERVLASKARWLRHQPALAPTVRNLGAVLISAGDFTRALPSFEQALALSESSAQTTPEYVAKSLSDLGYALTLTEQYARAELMLDRAIRILEKHPTPNELPLAWTLERKGNLLLQRGWYPAARPVLERALAIAENIAPSHPETSRLLDTFGNLCWFEGNSTEAERYYRRALAVAKGTLRVEHPSIAVYMTDLADSRTRAGYVAEAQSLQERALAISQKSLGQSHVELAWQLNNLAITHVTQGDYAAARPLYERALGMITRQFGPSHFHVATLANNLALLNARLGDFDEAHEQIDRAVAIWRRVLGPRHPYVGAALDSLAEVFAEQGRLDDARALYERALDVRQHALQPAHRDVAETLTSLAETLGRLGDLPRALECSRRALTIWGRIGSSEDGLYARALAVQAQLSLQADDPRAGEQFTDAIARLKKVVGTVHPEIATAQAGLAAALMRRGRYALALTEALRAEDMAREHVRVTTRYLAERQALFFAGRRPPALDIALSALSRASTSTPDNARVLDVVIRSRALVLDELATRHRTTIEGRAPSLEPLAKALVTARQRLANLLVAGPRSDSAASYLPLVTQAKREKERAERTLAEQSVRFRRELAHSKTGLDEVRAALPHHTALVSYVRYTDVAAPDRNPRRAPETAYAAFVLRAGESQVSFVPLGAAATFDDWIARWREVVSVPPSSVNGSRSSADLRYRRAGMALRRRIWDPIRVRLRDVTNVLIVPDGPLNLVSFAALPSSNAEFLVERGPAIHYLSAERDLSEADDRRPSGDGLLAIGAPAFDDEPLPVRAGAAAAASDVRLAGGSERRQPTVPCRGFAGLRFGPLPAAQLEVDEIASVWTGRTSATTTRGGHDGGSSLCRVLAGAGATEAAVKRLAPGQRVLHFATHGFFLGSSCASAVAGSRSVGGLAGSDVGTFESMENPLVRSGLALAGANRRATTQPGTHEDGILTAEEVAGLELDGVEWAVLSACDTGIGEMKAGEGVFGLRRAFQIAGASTVIMSLWAVEDDSARQWMRALYDARVRQKLDTIHAVRRASLDVLRDRRHRGMTTHPFYWAGFVAAGGWR